MSKTVFILGHAKRRPGDFVIFLQYLHHKGHKAKLLLHPYEDYSHLDTVFTVDENVVIYPRKDRGYIFNLLQDTWLSLKILKQANFDYFIGATNIDVLPGIIRRKLLRAKVPYILYYPRDYREARYKNPFFNSMYYLIERIAVKYSDLTVSNTKRAESKRLGHGLAPKKSIVIQNPVKITNPAFQPKSIRKDRFIYQGDLSQEHGLYDLVKTITPIISKLVIIGDGDDWDRTIALANRSNLSLETHRAKTQEFVSEYLMAFEGIGLAPYNLTSKWPYYASPMKVGDYITCGIPVLMSDVPEVAQEVKERGLGVVYGRLSLCEIKEQLANLSTAGFEKKAQQFYSANNIDALLGLLPNL
jgi:glycosyltransferase involved in cell wall biosynthesis